MKLILIAWKNLWRNKRRTMITISSVLFGVLFSSMMYSLEEGSYGNMIDNMVRLSSGYLNIQQKDFRETRSINDCFLPDDSLWNVLGHTPEITLKTARLQSVALASTGDKTYPVMVLGIEPDKELIISNISKWIQYGQFIHPGDPGVVLGSVLADNLQASCGDTLILVSQGYHGVSTAGKFPITGIISLPSPVLNRQLVYMSLPVCQAFYGTGNQITSLMIMLKDYEYVLPVKNRLEPVIPEDLRLYTWQELNPELVQFIQGKKSSGNIFLGILFMIIGFGILGTLIIFSETIFLALIGIATGLFISVPVIFYLIRNPIPVTGTMKDAFLQLGFEPVILFSLKPYVLFTPVIIVFIITFFVSLYIFYAIFKLKETTALHG